MAIGDWFSFVASYFNWFAPRDVDEQVEREPMLQEEGDAPRRRNWRPACPEMLREFFEDLYESFKEFVAMYRDVLIDFFEISVIILITILFVMFMQWSQQKNCQNWPGNGPCYDFPPDVLPQFE